MISVCMATYNGEKYIYEQVESILEQLGPNDELVISDDLSNDNTINILKNINDNRIKIYYNYGIHGFVKNFESALKHANGDYIFLSDQDDIWMSNKVKLTMEYLTKYDFVVSDCVTINSKGDIISSSRFFDYKVKKGFWHLMIKTRYLGCCMAFKRNVLEACLPFPTNTYYLEHDLWIAAVAERYFHTELIKTPLIKYRRHGNNVSTGGNGKGYSFKVKLLRRLYRLKCINSIKNKVKKIKGV